MKKTIAVFMALFALSFIFMGASEGAFGGISGKGGCCDQTFRVVDSRGNPVANCMVTIAGPCGSSCQTKSNGECTMCIGNCGTMTVSAACCGGSTNFTPCTVPVVVITCP